MKALALLVVLAACDFEKLPQLGGGGIDAHPGDGAGGVDGSGIDAAIAARHVRVAWSLQTHSGTVQNCPGNQQTIVVRSQELDANNAPVGAPVVDLSTCTAGGITTSALHASRYSIDVEITTSTQSSTYATSIAQVVDLTTADGTYSTVIYTDAGYFALAWRLIGGSTQNTLTCAQAGTPNVEIDSTLQTTGAGSSDIFTCSDGRGLTSALIGGAYTAAVAATNTANQAVSNTSTSSATINVPNKVTDLGTITLVIPNM